MAADFIINQVVIGGCHHSKDGYLLLFPHCLKNFSKCCHEEEEQNWCHVVALSYSNSLRNLHCFLFNFEYAYVVNIYSFDCCNKFGGGLRIALRCAIVVCGFPCHML